jgi:hypothetical protein
MVALAESLLPPVPPEGAPELFDYPQFTPCDVPYGTGASKAYCGFIRPFYDDATARRVLRAIEEDLPLQVSGGRLEVELLAQRSHPLDEFLVDMAMPFTILLLEFPGSEHPRTFLLDPPMIPRISQCHHLRTDKSIQIDGKPLPALCVYSGSLQRFDSCRSRLEQLLDQTATYLAKYLIWRRTRKLYRRTQNGAQLVRPRTPRGKITTAEVSRSVDLFWEGYWPGRSAPAGPAAHLATIRPEDECWCWSGKSYVECCRPRELTLMAKLESDLMRAEFVQKLMAAVRSRIESRRE